MWVVALPLHFYLHQNLNYNLNFFFEKEKQTCTEYLVKLRFIWGFHTAITYIINYRVYLPLFCFFPISSYNFYLFNFCFFSVLLFSPRLFFLPSSYSCCCWHRIQLTTTAAVSNLSHQTEIDRTIVGRPFRSGQVHAKNLEIRALIFQ